MQYTLSKKDIFFPYRIKAYVCLNFVVFPQNLSFQETKQTIGRQNDIVEKQTNLDLNLSSSITNAFLGKLFNLSKPQFPLIQ